MSFEQQDCDDSLRAFPIHLLTVTAPHRRIVAKMPKRTLFTNITPLPAEITREVAIAMLHDHGEMIELNPLVIEHHTIKTPRDAPADEFLDCVWQELTDKIHYLPGGMVKGKVTYRACFHDLPQGLQTHIYAPTGLDIREHWSIGGSLPGEPEQPRELGLDVPRTGLYLREDCDMRSNRLLTRFIRKNLDNSHKTLVERILKKAQRIERHLETNSPNNNRPNYRNSAILSPGFQAGSHMANSKFINAPLSPQGDGPSLADHPAFRSHTYNQSVTSTQTNSIGSYSTPSNTSHAQSSKTFVAELPGSTYHTSHLADSGAAARGSAVSEMTGEDANRSSTATQSNSEGSRVSQISAEPPPVGYRYNPQDFVKQDDRDARRRNRLSELPAGV